MRVTKEQVIERYLSSKANAESLLPLFMEEGELGKVEEVENHITLINEFIEKLNAENPPTTEELQTLYNIALSWDSSDN